VSAQSSEELLRQVSRKSDLVRVRVVTPNYQIEGDMHCPRNGKVGRSLSHLLNHDGQKRNFIALTNVLITSNEGIAVESLPFIQVSMRQIEYLYPIASDEDPGDGVLD